MKIVTNFFDYYKNKCFNYLGLVELSDSPQNISDSNLYINSLNDIIQNRLKEYKIWYKGDGDDLLNFYTGNMLCNYNTESFYDRNKRSYFWSIASTEADIKRTHSCQPRNIVDTLVNITGVPNVSLADPDENAKLHKILDDNNFDINFLQEYLPSVLVEGWGCFRIDYDTSFRSTPIVRFFHATQVDFIESNDQIVSILFKTYYTDEDGKEYLLVESRTRKSRSLVIEKDLFKTDSSGTLEKVPLKSLRQLRDVEERLELNDYEGFLAVPCIVYKNKEAGIYGRSIYTGKIDLFDDLDQCLSQAANTVRRSTTRVYMNSNYLERDSKTGMPIAPSLYDCKYVLYNGGLGADGLTGNQEPVSTVQPRLDFRQYSDQAVNLLVQIVSGVLSPATLGIDIAKKDNAAAQREKEKVTIFTRQTVIRAWEKICRILSRELMCCEEMMKHGKISKHEYDVSVKFSEFSNDSFESRAEILLTLYDKGVMTPELFVKELYKDTLSSTDREAQVQYIMEQKQVKQMAQFGAQPTEAEQALAAQAGAMPNENNEQVAEMAAMMGR